jgi:Protein of unknown function (DUF3570)
MRLQVGGILGAFGALAGAGLAACPVAAADLFQDPAASYTFNVYSDVQGVNVNSQYANTNVKLTPGANLTLQWVHDVVHFPAIEAAPGTQEAADAITSASRPIASSADPYVDYVKVRNSLEGSATYRGASGGYYVSRESDYFAQMVSGSYNHDVLNDNLNISGGASYSWDHITPLTDADTQGTPDYRRTTHWNLVATQILTRTTVLRAGVELNTVHGLQHDPYRNVYVAGANVPENHPNHRVRRDLYMGVNQYFYNRSSVNLEYRYYSDDWGVSSNTIGVKLNQYINDAFTVRYRYRYYGQGAATFYRDEYTAVGGVDGFQTNDYRLGDFNSHLFGGRVLWRPWPAMRGPGFMASAEVMFSYERYFNSNNFSANIIETGLLIAF